ncbi:HET-domain-containing protein, partial [Thozetella sp. PMI_491]
LPTRVIDVGDKMDQTTVRLVETHGTRNNYAALSHCWGPPNKQPLRTVKATFQQHLLGISLSQLPKTFRDAVAIARLVKLRYLWIDSLCIIQDDLEDWTKEAPCMGQLYNRAHLVIAASGARDSSEGCFIQRLAPRSSIAIPFKREGSAPNGHVWLNTADDGAVGPHSEPLAKRGWVLQEWALARRLVHFTAKGMMWFCLEMDESTMCEDGTLAAGNKLSNWDGIIEEFTARQLTYLTDKLVAVEGIAGEMKSSREDQYASGVWTGELPQQLFWIGRDTQRPPELNMLPSWSWAS